MTTPRSELDGATALPCDGVQVANAGEFAAYWNSLNAEQRESTLEAIRSGVEDSARCFMHDHDRTIDRLTTRLEGVDVYDVELLTRERDAARAERDEAREVIAGGPHITAKHWGKLQNARARIEELEADPLVDYNRRRDAERRAQTLERENAAIRAERDALATVIEKAKAELHRIEDAQTTDIDGMVSTVPWARSIVGSARRMEQTLASADTDAELREVRAKALEDAAETWGADPDAWGDNDKDYRNELRDRATAIREGRA